MNTIDKNEKYEGPFISDLIKVVFGRKLLLCIITVCLTIIIALGLKLGISNRQTCYQTTFTYSNENLNYGEYVDGSVFNFKTLTNYDILKEIKDSNEEFSSINVDKIVSNQAISITSENEKRERPVLNVVNEKTGETNQTLVSQNYNINYTIKVNKQYFKNASQAEKFLTAIAEKPNLTNIDIVSSMTFQSNFTAINETNYYENKIDLLESQYNIILNEYKKLSSSYSNLYINISDNIKTVQDANTLFISNFKTNSLESLMTDSILYGYIENFESSEKNLTRELNNAIYQYKLLDSKIKSLKDFYSNSQVVNQNNDEYNSLIIEKEDTKVSIQRYAKKFLAYGKTVTELVNSFSGLNDVYTEEELTEFKATVDNSNIKSFVSELNNVIAKMKEYTRILNEVETKVIEKRSMVTYETVSTIETVGGINNALIAIISIVIGFVCAASVNICLDYKKIYKKDNDIKNDK